MLNVGVRRGTLYTNNDTFEYRLIPALVPADTRRLKLTGSYALHRVNVRRFIHYYRAYTLHKRTIDVFTTVNNYECD